MIGEALDSIRSQTVRPLEVVVCDDGSTDDLEHALAPYQDEIVFLQKENGGEASAKNAGAAVARAISLRFSTPTTSTCPTISRR